MYAGLQQMGGRAVAQRVDRSTLRETTGRESRPAGILPPGAWHGVGGGGHPDSPTARGRQEPHGMAVGFPGLSEQRQGAGWQGPRAGPGACAAAPRDAQTGTVDIGDLQVGTLV